MKCLLSHLLLLAGPAVCSQNVPSILGARTTALGQIGSVVSEESWIFGNVGALGTAEFSSAFFACQVRPALTGANQAAASVTLSGPHFSVAAGVSSFGDNVFSERTATAGIGNKLGLASIGASISLVQISTIGASNLTTISIQCGGLAHLTPEITVGAYIQNLNQPIVSADERLPARLVAGIAFQPEHYLLIAAEVEKHIEFKPTWKGGIEYVIFKKLAFRTGFNLNPNTAFAGLGMKWQRIKVDYSMSFNRLTGSTHQVSAVWFFKARP